MKNKLHITILVMLTILLSSYASALQQYTLNLDTTSYKLNCLEEVMARVESCQPEGVNRIVYNGKPAGKLAGVTYFNTKHIYIYAVNKQPYNLMQIIGHEINEAQCHYGCKVQNHHALQQPDEWSTIKCKK